MEEAECAWGWEGARSMEVGVGLALFLLPSSVLGRELGMP